MHTWDVVNEALADDGSMRQSIFYNTIGEYYIDIAFKTAKAADSAAILAINDYNIDGTGAKSTVMINLVTKMKARGVPIEQVGIQAHLIVGSVPTTLSTNWNAFVNLGVSIAITELDIRMPTPATTANLAQQATDYSICLVPSECMDLPRTQRMSLTLAWESPNAWVSHSGASAMRSLGFQTRFLDKVLRFFTMQLFNQSQRTPLYSMPSTREAPGLVLDIRHVDLHIKRSIHFSIP